MKNFLRIYKNLTLIEIMVMVFILGIVASIVSGSFVIEQTALYEKQKKQKELEDAKIVYCETNSFVQSDKKLFFATLKEFQQYIELNPCRE